MRYRHLHRLRLLCPQRLPQGLLDRHRLHHCRDLGEPPPRAGARHRAPRPDRGAVHGRPTLLLSAIELMTNFMARRAHPFRFTSPSRTARRTASSSPRATMPPATSRPPPTMSVTSTAAWPARSLLWRGSGREFRLRRSREDDWGGEWGYIRGVIPNKYTAARLFWHWIVDFPISCDNRLHVFLTLMLKVTILGYLT